MMKRRKKMYTSGIPWTMSVLEEAKVAPHIVMTMKANAWYLNWDDVGIVIIGSHFLTAQK